MKKERTYIRFFLPTLLFSLLVFAHSGINALTPTDYQAEPIIGSTSEPPLVMLVMGRNHKLYYEAYNDASDLNEDGVLDVGYNPAIEYYGYFDSYKVYTYSSSNQRFEPLRETDTKMVNRSATNEWSGDFLNYLTMCRMDAMRKVLFGGYRLVDTATETVLERAYIPRDAHTWGKEYESEATDGYDIRDYTPLELPETNTRHLFASTSLTDPSDSDYRPLLRVLPNNIHRIWEWVSKERPVADDSLVSSGGYYDQHPDNHDEYEDMIDMFANASHFQGSSPATQINGAGNPHGDDEDYLTIFTGNINITTGGTYQFAVDGDDAVEIIVDGVVVASWYGGHGKCSCTSYNGSIDLTAGSHAIEFRHEEDSGGDNYYLYWNGPDSGSSWEIVPASAYTDLIQTNYDLEIGSSTITDYVVRVQVAMDTMPEKNCKLYTDEDTGVSVYKPVGLLQRYGEPERMYFGLMTGSYTENTSGGVLRRNIGDIKEEIDQDTGQFTSVNGIIQTINKLRVVDFDYSSYSYNSNCGWVATRAINEGECRMWGNPIGEMMYETLRYFAGKGTPTSEFTYGSDSGYDDNELDLPNPTWEDPYDTYPYCAKPFMLVLSDINPTYDSEELPGSYFEGITGDLTGLDVRDLADAIGTAEGELGDYYIGQKGGTYDGACTSKTLSGGLGDIRGLCPEEPTKKGSYYSASVAYFGHMNDISPVSEDQLVNTFAVGLASPLPRIEIPIGSNWVTLVPFAKSVGGYSISAAEGDFQPTNTIVDFYVDTIEPTYGKFRINYEDVEQGADHDMDAITIYEYQVLDAAGDPVTDPANGVKVKITLESDYAAGSIIQHSGYIISGTTQDGTYLEVRDVDTGAASDPDYFLDTPPGELPGGNWDDDTALGLYAEREFTPWSEGDTEPTSLLKNPLWYAGKWGGFEDQNDNDLPDLNTEWDTDADTIPDNYFYVTNPLRLEAQLNASFAKIAAKSASGTSASVLATTNEGEGTLIQAYFRPVTATDIDEVHWMGFLQSLWVDDMGYIREDTDGNQRLDTASDNVLVFKLINGETMVRRYTVSAGNRYPDIDTDGYLTIGMEDVLPIWEAGNVLADTDPSDRNIFTSTSGNADDLIAFEESNLDSVKNFLGVSNSDITNFPEANIELLGSDLDTRAQTLMSFIRGTDVTGLRNRTIDDNVWKLGDIVYSTPISVSKPVESYHALYSDREYGEYFDDYKDRPTVVYAGGNDGMLHAFTSWRYDTDSRTFTYSSTDTLGNQGAAIGDELWAYIPRAVLPHLKWLADPEYEHSYFVDLTPKVFDAKIAGTGNDEWGTFLLLGLNMGGKDIEVDSDGDGTMETFKPSYTLLDITNPKDPKLMWERTYDGLGMSRSIPAIIKTGGSAFNQEGLREYSGRAEMWYAVFGSGPQGDLAYQGVSDQPGRIFVVDLRTGDPIGSGGNDYLFTTSNNAVINAPVSLDKGMDYEVNSIYFGEAIIADPADENSGWTGKAWSIDTYASWSGVDPETGDVDPDYWEVTNDPTQWHLHLMLEEFRPDPVDSPVSLGPITGPMALSVDWHDNTWIYFGTGRYVSIADKTDTDQQYLFGIKDPLYQEAREYISPAYTVGDDQALDFDTKGGLLNASRYRVKTDRTVEYLDDGGGSSEIGDFNTLLEMIRQDNVVMPDGTVYYDTEWLDGWHRALSVSDELNPGPSERCISKFSILGGAVYVPTYTPSEEECKFGGNSNLFGLYFETGTAYYKPLLLPSEGDYLEEQKELGEGAPPPIGGIHIGREQGGKAFLQMSTGEIIEAEVDPAFQLKSRIVNWFD